MYTALIMARNTYVVFTVIWLLGPGRGKCNSGDNFAVFQIGKTMS